jgi:hypothetical protein
MFMPMSKHHESPYFASSVKGPDRSANLHFALSAFCLKRVKGLSLAQTIDRITNRLYSVFAPGLRRFRLKDEDAQWRQEKIRRMRLQKQQRLSYECR